MTGNYRFTLTDHTSHLNGSSLLAAFGPGVFLCRLALLVEGCGFSSSSCFPLDTELSPAAAQQAKSAGQQPYASAQWI